MKLEDFVSETILNIIRGVANARDQSAEFGATVNPSRPTKHGTNVNVDRNSVTVIQDVQFDVAITTQEATGTKGSIGIFVGPVGVGTQGKTDTARQSESRIKFSVPITLPNAGRE